jgi:two-component system NtrC family sensor kinase
MTFAPKSCHTDGNAPGAEAANPEGQLDRLEAQLRELRNQLCHAQRMATLGTMAAMVAHEFNNLLTPILSYVPYALSQRDPKLLALALERTLKQVQKAKAICDRLLAGPGDGRGAADVALLGQVEEAIELLVRDLAKDQIELVVEVPADLRVMVEPELIQQVIANLVMNARQAMAGRAGRLTIWASNDPGDDVWVHLRDTGLGIPPELQPRIFQPFVSTKQDADRPDQRGIGLGLAVCRQIVEQHGGRITFQSTPGEGTTFSFSLPPAREHTQSGREAVQLSSGKRR